MNENQILIHIWQKPSPNYNMYHDDTSWQNNVNYKLCVKLQFGHVFVDNCYEADEVVSNV